MHIEQLAGTDINGALKISEAALNDLLNSEASPLRGATLAVSPHNEVVLRYGMLRARVALPTVIDVGAAPQVKLLLASFVVALAVGTAVRLPYVRVSGREVTILLAEVPELKSWRNVWPHLRNAGLRTAPGAIEMNFRFSVTE